MEQNNNGNGNKDGNKIRVTIVRRAGEEFSREDPCIILKAGFKSCIFPGLITHSFEFVNVG